MFGLFAALTLCVSTLSAASASAQPEVDLHNLKWFVHIDLIDADAGEDLAYWQGVLDETMATANVLLEGGQGPADQTCCTRLGRSVSVATFGTPDDGLDVIDSEEEQLQIEVTGGGGSRAFLVDSATYCSGTSPDAIGCAVRPSCSGNANDDPALWMYVTVDALDDGTLASVVAHERGHNACLTHVTMDKCQLMQETVFTPGLGGCLELTECNSYRAARTSISSGLECGCHDDSNGLIDDGAVCSEVLGGICSGGFCGSIAGGAGVQLIASANPGDAGLAPEDAIQLSGLTGHWENLGQISTSADDIRAMAYARDADTLYGVIPTIADDSIVTIDPTDGSLISTVGSIANGSDEIVSMAYDPGATESTGDDRLIVLEVTTDDSGEFRSISPASPSTATRLGSLGLTPASLFTGMAYDSVQDMLFLASPFGPHGLWRTDLSTCPPSPCATDQLTGAPGGYFRDNASLSYSPDTGMLYLIGDSFVAPNTRTFYDVIDPTTGRGVVTLSLDRFTAAGLAAVPEPGTIAASAVALASVFGVVGIRRLSCPDLSKDRETPGAGRGRRFLFLRCEAKSRA
jgi:hypothetical protein